MVVSRTIRPLRLILRTVPDDSADNTKVVLICDVASKSICAVAPDGASGGMGGKRLLKFAAVLTALAYLSLLAYQTTTSAPIDTRTQAAQIVDNVIDVDDYVNKVTTSVRTINLTLNDIFISVKTTRHYQVNRLPIILKTWFQLAKEQTWFFTDIDNPHHQKLTNGHMVNTNCSSTHQRKHLCCKMSVEYDTFLDSGKKWFCHFDDDNYVNVPRLEQLLKRYDPQMEWYLGRTSVYKPIKLITKDPEKSYKFWFATGGAGFCLSRALALKMVPLASGGRFMSVCEGVRLPDDVSIGFIIENLLKRELTQIPEFHSHFEQMKFIEPETFRDQVSFSYSKIKGEWNVVQVPGFDTNYDPTRFLSLHCFLFPHFKFCPWRRR